MQKNMKTYTKKQQPNGRKFSLNLHLPLDEEEEKEGGKLLDEIPNHSKARPKPAKARSKPIFDFALDSIDTSLAASKAADRNVNANSKVSSKATAVSKKTKKKDATPPPPPQSSTSEELTISSGNELDSKVWIPAPRVGLEMEFQGSPNMAIRRTPSNLNLHLDVEEEKQEDNERKPVPPPPARSTSSTRRSLPFQIHLNEEEEEFPDKKYSSPAAASGISNSLIKQKQKKNPSETVVEASPLQNNQYSSKIPLSALIVTSRKSTSGSISYLESDSDKEGTNGEKGTVKIYKGGSKKRKSIGKGKKDAEAGDDSDEEYGAKAEKKPKEVTLNSLKNKYKTIEKQKSVLGDGNNRDEEGEEDNEDTNMLEDINVDEKKKAKGKSKGVSPGKEKSINIFFSIPKVKNNFGSVNDDMEMEYEANETIVLESPQSVSKKGKKINSIPPQASTSTISSKERKSRQLKSSPIQVTKVLAKCPVGHFCRDSIPTPFSSKLAALQVEFNILQGKLRKGLVAEEAVDHSRDLFCSRHQAEVSIIPEGEKKKYLLNIDFKQIPDRLSRTHRARLEDIILGKAKSAFREEFLEKPSRNQGHSSGSSQMNCGYYGWTGSNWIFKTLMDLFNDESSGKKSILSKKAIGPHSVIDFLQLVLVPEAAICLIAEDRSIMLPEKYDKVLKILRESNEFGSIVHDDLQDEEIMNS